MDFVIFKIRENFLLFSSSHRVKKIDKSGLTDTVSILKYHYLVLVTELTLDG